jgi:hypothetical protein
MFMRPEPEYEWKLYRSTDGHPLAKRQLFTWLKGTHLQEEQREQPARSLS